MSIVQTVSISIHTADAYDTSDGTVDTTASVESRKAIVSKFTTYERLVAQGSIEQGDRKFFIWHEEGKSAVTPGDVITWDTVKYRVEGEVEKKAVGDVDLVYVCQGRPI